MELPSWSGWLFLCLEPQIKISADAVKPDAVVMGNMKDFAVSDFPRSTATASSNE